MIDRKYIKSFFHHHRVPTVSCARVLDFIEKSGQDMNYVCDRAMTKTVVRSEAPVFMTVRGKR